jgi:hypothetical protein
MRKLGKGQSVVFCVPPEIQTKIFARTAVIRKIDVSDILSWAISETCTDMRRSMPLWAAQGRRFEHQKPLWDVARASGKLMSRTKAKKFLEREAQSLEDRYRPRSGVDEPAIQEQSQTPNLELITERCREFGSLDCDSATFQEEQERELSHEIEQERQVQRPPPVRPALHEVHRDVIDFVFTGTLASGSTAYKPAFETLRSTSAAAFLEVSQFGDGLLVTADFAMTIQAVRRTSYVSDFYQRAPQWILTSTMSDYADSNIAQHMMIISPHEAQELLPIIEKSRRVALHVYAALPSLCFRPLDDLDLYTVPVGLGKRSLPRHLVIQLNLFAGQLYFSSFEEYIEVCEYLGLAWKKTGADCVVASDGFIIRGRNTQEASKSPFTASPVQFLKVLITKIRRNNEGIDKTHVGKLLDGQLLCRSDFLVPTQYP